MPQGAGWRTRKETRQTPVPTAEQLLQGMLNRSDARMQRLNDMYLRMMGEHIRDIGTLWPSDVHRLQQIRRMNKNLIDLEAEIAKAANLTIADVHKTFRQIAQTDYRMGARIMGQPTPSRVSDNEYLQRIIQAQAKETEWRMRNLSNTTVTSSAYRAAVDEGVNAVINGEEDYGSAIRRSLKNAGSMGLRLRPDGTRAVDYLSGHSRRLDSAVRMNILDGARHINQDVRNLVGQEFGADGVEIDAHALCAEDHLPYQGMQYSNADFELIQDSLQRPFGEWNCRHTWAPILLGISAPRYTQQELDEMRRYSTEQITIDGKTHSRYEWSQVQRRMETAIRQQKDTATLARYAGDDVLQRQCQERIRALNDQYDRVSAAAGLEPEYTRTDVFGFRDYKDNSSKMSKAQSSYVLSGPKPIKHTAEEYAQLTHYAQERGISVYNIETFDGDADMFKEQIDAIAEIQEEYKLSSRLTVRFDVLSSVDLAETNESNDVIIFDKSAMRDKQVTNAFLNADNYLAATDSKGIGYHEMGHIICSIYGNRGLDIAGEAYHNITGQTLMRNDIISYLWNNVSKYSVFIPQKWKGKAFQRRFYKEVIPEVLSMDKTNPTEFTREFIRILKERCGI